ncbi:MAG: 2'-5' RNA ligase family protein [Terracoccus sp.]
MSRHSIEAMFDPATDAAVREEWRALLDAGLRSQAAHPGATNAPHLTLSVARSIPESLDAVIERDLAADDLLPLEIGLGPVVVLGERRPVLARLVVPTTGLLRLHAVVAAATRGLDDVPATAAVGSWVPHVTLARLAHPEELGRAFGVLHELTPGAGIRVGRIESVRRWDPDERQVTAVAG